MKITRNPFPINIINVASSCKGKSPEIHSQSRPYSINPVTHGLDEIGKN
jgi:hypothetical protein